MRACHLNQPFLPCGCYGASELRSSLCWCCSALQATTWARLRPSWRALDTSLVSCILPCPFSTQIAFPPSACSFLQTGTSISWRTSRSSCAAARRGRCAKVTSRTQFAAARHTTKPPRRGNEQVLPSSSFSLSLLGGGAASQGAPTDGPAVLDGVQAWRRR